MVAGASYETDMEPLHGQLTYIRDKAGTGP